MINLQLKPGRLLDAKIAEKRMGWSHCDPLEESDPWEYSDALEDRIMTGIGNRPESQPGNRRRGPFPNYSTNMMSAWEVWTQVKREASVVPGPGLAGWYHFLRILRVVVSKRMGTAVMLNLEYAIFNMQASDICIAALWMEEDEPIHCPG